MNKDNLTAEKIFSVTMTEEELKLFSEFLGQKEYAVLPKAISTVRRKVRRVVKPTSSQRAAQQRLEQRRLKDPFFRSEEMRQRFEAPYGVTMPSYLG